MKLKFYSEGYVEVLDVESPRPLLFEDPSAVRRFLLKGGIFFCPNEKRAGRLVGDKAEWCDLADVPKSALSSLSPLVTVPDRDDIAELVLLVTVGSFDDGSLVATLPDGGPYKEGEFGNVVAVVF